MCLSIPLNGKSNGVRVVTGDHDADALLAAVADLLELGHPSHALGQAAVVHRGRGLVRLVDRVLVAQASRAFTLLKKIYTCCY